jgi:hypothetical protein
VSKETRKWVKSHPIKAAEWILQLELENREMRSALLKLGYIVENNQGTVVVSRDPRTLPEDVMP